MKRRDFLEMKQMLIDVSAYGEQNKCNLIVVSVFQYWLRKQSKPNDVMLQATLYHSFLLDFAKNVYPPFTRYIYFLHLSHYHFMQLRFSMLDIFLANGFS